MTFQASGKVTSNLLSSTSYQSPKPSLGVEKKVSPFVLKTVSKNTPSPSLTTLQTDVRTVPDKTEVEISTMAYKSSEKREDDDDSLDIGVRKRPHKREVKIASSSDESPQQSSSSGSSLRRSLRRRSTKPPIIEDDDSKEPFNLDDVPQAGNCEPNTVDVLEISFGLRAPSDIFTDLISIRNSATTIKPSKSADVMKIGANACSKVPKTDCDIKSADVESSGNSLEILDKLSSQNMTDDEYLPPCGMEAELKLQEKTPDLPRLESTEEEHLLQKDEPLIRTRKKQPCNKVLETPYLNNAKQSPAPVTPLLIRSTNTVLETPIVAKTTPIMASNTVHVGETVKTTVAETPKISKASADETPLTSKASADETPQTSKANVTKTRQVVDRDVTDTQVIPKTNVPDACLADNDIREGKKRSMNRKYSKEDVLETSAEKRARLNNSYPTKDTSLQDKKSNPKMKDFIKQVANHSTKRYENCTPVSRKNAVVESIPLQNSKSKTSPTLTIDKDGNRTNYTIEQSSPAGKLTIIQEGPIISPKLMKHIYEDVLQSDPNSCEDLINSLTADRNSFTAPMEVDHKGLIFGQDSLEQCTSDSDYLQENNNNTNNAVRSRKPGHNLSDAGKTDNMFDKREDTHVEMEAAPCGMDATQGKVDCADDGPDSLEGYTYNDNEFNENEFKRTFGLVKDTLKESEFVVENTVSYSQPVSKKVEVKSRLDDMKKMLEGREENFAENFSDNVTYAKDTLPNEAVYQQETNLCDEAKLSQLSQKLLIKDSQTSHTIKDSQPDTHHTAAAQGGVFDTVPDVTMSRGVSRGVIGDSVTTVAESLNGSQTDINPPFSTSTQHTKVCPLSYLE